MPTATVLRRQKERDGVSTGSHDLGFPDGFDRGDKGLRFVGPECVADASRPQRATDDFDLDQVVETGMGTDSNAGDLTGDSVVEEQVAPAPADDCNVTDLARAGGAPRQGVGQLIVGAQRERLCLRDVPGIKGGQDPLDSYFPDIARVISG